MKALKLTLIAVVLVGAISCKKTSVDSTVTADQAADIAAGSVAQNSFGFASVADNISVNAQTLYSISNGTQAINTTAALPRQTCGTTVADSLSGSGSSSSVTYSFFYKYLRTLNCNTNNIPDNLANAITFKGSFDGPRLTSVDAGTATIAIAGLTPTAANFVVNGEYVRKGAFTSKVGSKASGTSTVDIKATNVLLSKPDRTIASGTATITVAITAPSGTFNFTGDLVFNGSNVATLTVGSLVYTINMITGTYVKK